MTEPGALRVRTGTPADLVAVARIEGVSFSDPWPRHALLAELEADTMRVPLVAEQGGHLVGYLMAWRLFSRLHVLNLAVDPQRRRSGIGGALLAAAIDRARTLRVDQVTLEVRPSNTGALAFYEYFGFAPTGRRERYYLDSGEDALVLTLRLDR